MKKFLISNSSYQLTDHICLAYIAILTNNFPHNNKKEGMCEKEGIYEKDIYECIYRPYLHWQAGRQAGRPRSISRHAHFGHHLKDVTNHF